MQLRIFRRFTWEIDCPMSEIRFGGRNPMKLVAHDELQFNRGGNDWPKWETVPIVEDEKPLSPEQQAEQEELDKTRALFSDLRAKAKKLDRAI